MDRKQIDDLYNLYGFSKYDSNPDYNIYLYDQGYFNNAEIVLFNSVDSNTNEVLKRDLIQAGYSVSIKNTSELESLKEDLFNGFFKISSSNNRIKNDYKEFCDIQTRKNGGLEYRYIASQYSLNGAASANNIIDTLYDLIFSEGAQLIILEAPAGFGKTCTSYEISNEIVQRNQKVIPILAELSKNRKAKIFNYVLYSEIDRKFSQLSSDLVTSQIKEGKIPLIIDGFDELLSKSSSGQDGIEDAKTMLDTVAELFADQSQAKVLLTSRKSSIFVGEAFDEWISDKIDNCSLNRIQILSPTITDWIGREKENVLSNAGISVSSIANPVLLSVINSMEISSLEKNNLRASDLLNQYLEGLLNREKERQQLVMSVEEQMYALQKLAAMMVELDITADESDGIKALIEEIVSPKIDEYLNRYNDKSEWSKPSEDEFVMKLVHNALLDRVKIDTNDIGFINDFIFGIFIGSAIIQKELSISDIEGQYLSFAISAFSSESDDKVDRLIDEINKIDEKLNTEHKLLICSCLACEMIYDFVDEYISNFTFDSSVNWATDYYFYNCTFVECTFNHIEIDSNIFEGCFFINCSFYDISINPKESIEEASTFVSCVGHDSLMDTFGIVEINDTYDEIKDETYYERIVLEQFWMPGSQRAEFRKTYTTLFKGVEQKERQNISKAIDRLFSRNILRKLNNCLELNREKIKEVKEILGREDI